MRRALVGAALALFFGATSAARAEDRPVHVIEAERLFEAGKEQLAKDDWIGACKLFDASVELDDAAPALVKVARCRAHEGRHALAIAAYARALGREPWPELEQLIRSERREEEARAATIVVRVIAPPEGLVLLRNGAALSLEDVKSPLFTDPGTTERFTAEAPGHVGASYDLGAESAGQALELTIRLEREAPPPAPPPPIVKVVKKTRVVRTVDPVRATGYALGGAGVLALGFSAGFGIQFLVLRDAVFDDCAGELPDGTHVCPADTSARQEDAIAARTRAYVLLGVGGALAAAGLTVTLLTWPSDGDETSASLRAGLRVGLGTLSLEGAF